MTTRKPMRRKTTPKRQAPATKKVPVKAKKGGEVSPSAVFRGLRIVLVPDAATARGLGASVGANEGLNLVALAKALERPPAVAWESGGRVATTLANLSARLDDAPVGEGFSSLPRGDGFEMAARALQYSIPAAVDALDSLVAVTDARSLGTNWLSFINQQVGSAISRALLLYWMRALNFNLQFVGEVLGLGGTQGVLRAIDKLGGEVAEAYQSARAEGLITSGGRRPRVRTPADNGPMAK